MSAGDTETHIVKSTDDARAGITGHGVRYVLGISLVASIVLAFVVLGVYVGVLGSG